MFITEPTSKGGTKQGSCNTIQTALKVVMQAYKPTNINNKASSRAACGKCFNNLWQGPAQKSYVLAQVHMKVVCQSSAAQQSCPVQHINPENAAHHCHHRTNE
jgi:hypothetical protein